MADAEAEEPPLALLVTCSLTLGPSGSRISSMESSLLSTDEDEYEDDDEELLLPEVVSRDAVTLDPLFSTTAGSVAAVESFDAIIVGFNSTEALSTVPEANASLRSCIRRVSPSVRISDNTVPYAPAICLARV